MKRDTLDINYLKELYYTKNMSLKEVSYEMDVSESTILRVMIAQGLERRDRKNEINVKDKINLKELKKLYYKKMYGMKRLAEYFKVSESSILNIMRANKLDRRSQTNHMRKRII